MMINHDSFYDGAILNCILSDEDPETTSVTYSIESLTFKVKGE